MSHKLTISCSVILLILLAAFSDSFLIGQQADTQIKIELLTEESIELTWPVSPEEYELDTSTELTTASWSKVNQQIQTGGNQNRIELDYYGESRFFRLREVEPKLLGITSSSPSSRDASVAVTRETVVRFSRPLHPDSVVTSAHFFARAGGDDLPARIHLSADRRSVTLFYAENLPGNARVDVVFNGTGLKDDLGRIIDADGDGQPGGSIEFQFNTLGLQPLEGTAVVGNVYASELGAGNGETVDTPLEGVTIFLDGLEQTINTTTDSEGYFKLEPVPAGEFFVHIYGRTAVGSDYPDGAYYATVGKSWNSVPGRDDNLAGGTGNIYLPLIYGNSLHAVSETEDTEITFTDDIIQDFPELDGVSITVPAGALFDQDGTRGGMVGIAPVAPDRLPEPLPDGLNFPLVITVQTNDRENFDIPVPVRFPNLPDSVTGETLSPGAKTALWSFNHDTGYWESVGMMTISADGLYAVSDPGSGILAPGWHGVGSGSGGGGPRPRKKKDPEPEDPFPDREDDDPDDCTKEIICTEIVSERNLAHCLLECTGNVLDQIFGDDKTERSPMELGLCTGNALTCKDQWETLEEVVDSDRWDNSLTSDQTSCMDECMTPTAATFPVIVPCEGFFDPCPEMLVFSPTEMAFLQSAGVVFGLEELETQILPDWIAEQKAIWKAEADYFSLVFGTPKIAQTDPLELELLRAFFNRFGEITSSDSEEGIIISTSERTGLLELPRVSQFSDPEWMTLLERMELMRNNALPPEEYDEAAIKAAAEYANDVTQLLINRGWERREDGLIFGLARLSLELAPEVGSEEFPARGHHYLIRSFDSGFDRRGRLSSNGSIEGVIFAPNEYHMIAYVDPVTLNVGAATFFSNSTGNTTIIPTAPLIPSSSNDSDNDGLSDIAEQVIGTLANNPDTDADGVSDGIEVQMGSDPLDGIPVSTGIIASIGTTDETTDVVVEGNIAVVADGENGIKLIDVSNFFSPIVLSEFPLPGTAKHVAISGNHVIVGLGNQQLAFVDISNPSEPIISQVTKVPGDVKFTVTQGNYGYVSMGLLNSQYHLIKYDLELGTEIWRWTTELPLGDIALSRGIVYALSTISLEILEDSLNNPTEVVSFPVEAPSSQRVNGRTLFVGGDYAYIGYNTGYSILDVSNPSQPILVGEPQQPQPPMVDIVASGSGLIFSSNIISLGNPRLTLGVYNVSDPTNVNSLVTQIVTPGVPLAIQQHRGVILVADSQAGLQIVNFISPDLAGVAPEVSLEAGFSLNPAEAQSNSETWIGINAADDVQVRDVELYIDGAATASYTNFPYNFNFITPQLTQSKTNFTVQAKATDMAGSFTWTDLIEVDLIDTLPPQFSEMEPDNGSVLQTEILSTISVRFNEQPNTETINGQSFRLFEAGPDETLNTPDDVLINSVIDFDANSLIATLSPSGALEAGLYRVSLSTEVSDVFGNSLTEALVWEFEVRDPNEWINGAGGSWAVGGNWSNGSIKGQDNLIIDIPNEDAPTQISSGTFSITSLLSEEDFTLTVGTLNVAEEATINGNFTWTSQSALGGGGTTMANGGMLIDGLNSHLLNDHWLVNNGLAQWTNGAIYLGHSQSLFMNSTGATLELLNESYTVIGDSGNFDPLGVINDGALIKNSESGLRIANLSFENNGTIDVKLGELEIFGGGYFGEGSIVVRTGATLHFSTGLFSDFAGSILGGSLMLEEAGTLKLVEGFVSSLGSDIAGDGDVVLKIAQSKGVEIFGNYDVGTTSFEGGPAAFHSLAKSNSAQIIHPSVELVGAGIFESTSDFLWTTGKMAGRGTTRIRGTLRMEFNQEFSDRALRLENRTLEIIGEAIGSPGVSIEPKASTTSRIHVLPGAVWRQTDDFGIEGDSTGEDWLFTNDGSFIKEGALNGEFNIHFLNSGLIEIKEGTLLIVGDFQQTAGEIRLSESNLQAWSLNGGVRLQGGSITGTGEFGFHQFSTFSDVENSGGAISPGDNANSGTVTIKGEYMQSGSGSIAIDIFGLPEEAGPDKVTVSRGAVLGGILEIRIAEGFVPAIGASYTILDGTSRTGEFGTVTGLEISADRKFEVVYTATAVQINVVSIP
ncbi:MAG: Ig-like domain-containing protein [Verrucomicrobia bacterium]|nr:Ig-like domain-containing protein [Verrucomicrobiota bacterium]MDA1067640.1 Ig-like domain-containing protein [Verrucomicrobiota bacterium]